MTEVDTTNKSEAQIKAEKRRQKILDSQRDRMADVTHTDVQNVQMPEEYHKHAKAEELEKKPLNEIIDITQISNAFLQKPSKLQYGVEIIFIAILILVLLPIAQLLPLQVQTFVVGIQRKPLLTSFLLGMLDWIIQIFNCKKASFLKNIYFFMKFLALKMLLAFAMLILFHNE